MSHSLLHFFTVSPFLNTILIICTSFSIDNHHAATQRPVLEECVGKQLSIIATKAGAGLL